MKFKNKKNMLFLSISAFAVLIYALLVLAAPSEVILLGGDFLPLSNDTFFDSYVFTGADNGIPGVGQYNFTFTLYNRTQIVNVTTVTNSSPGQTTLTSPEFNLANMILSGALGTGITDGSYNLSVNATNASFSVHNATYVNISFDTAAPNFSIESMSPVNGSNLSRGIVGITLFATDPLVNGVRSNLLGVSWNFTNSSASSNNSDVIFIGSEILPGRWGYMSFDPSNFEEGHQAYFINNLTDNVGNANATIDGGTIRFSFTVDRTAPTVNLNASSVTTINTTPQIHFNYTDALFVVANCSLYINGTYNNTNGQLTLNATNTNLTASGAGFLDGHYNASVTCIDGSGNNGNSSMTLIVQTYTPEVTFVTPSQAGLGFNESFVLNVSTVYDATNVTYVLFNRTGGNQTPMNVSLTRTDTAGGTFWNATIDADSLSDDNYSLLINATNRHGENANTTRLVFIDQTTPSTVSFSCDDVTVGASQSCSCSATDNLDDYGSSTNTSITSASTSAAGTNTVYCTVEDLSGNTVRNATTYTVSAAASSSSSSSGGSGGGGSGSGGASGGVSNSVSGQFKKKIWTSVNPGERADVAVENGEIGVTNVEFGVSEKVYGGWINVKKVDKLPRNVPSFTREVYRTIEIQKGNAFKNDVLEDVSIDFKVEKKWLTEQKLNKNDVALFRYTTQWDELQPKITKEDETYVHYQAKTPGFSFFVIGEKEVKAPLPVAEEDTPTDITQPTGEEPVEQPSAGEEGSSRTTPIVVAVLIILLLIGVAVAIYLKRPRLK